MYIEYFVAKLSFSPTFTISVLYLSHVQAYLYEYDYPIHGDHTDDVYFLLGFHEYELVCLKRRQQISQILQMLIICFVRTNDYVEQEELIQNIL